MSESSYQRYLQRYEKWRQADRDADVRAIDLLAETLDDLQFNLLYMMAETNDEVFIPVIGRYGNYHVSRHTTLCFGTHPSLLFCLHPGSYLEQHDLFPIWDSIAMHKLMLDAEEETFLWTANQQMPSVHICKQVQKDMHKLELWLEVMTDMDNLDEGLKKLVAYYREGLGRKSFERHPLAGVLVPTSNRSLTSEQRISTMAILRGRYD